MSKTNIYTRLNRIFSSTQKTSLPKTLPPPETPEIPTNYKESISDLLSQKDPEKLIQKFNSLSIHPYVRRQYKLYEIIIYRLTLANRLSLIEDTLETQKKYISGEAFASRLITLYGKTGMFDHARKLFDEMPERKCERGVRSFNALLGAAIDSKKFDKAYELFRELPSKISVKPSVESYGMAVNALCKLGLLDEAVSLLDEMEVNGLKISVVCFTTIMGSLCRKEDFVEAEKIWDRMIKGGVKPNMCSYICRMQVLTSEGNLSNALELLEQLKDKGLTPSVEVYNVLIQGFCKTDDLDGAKKYYRELLEHNHEPNRNTFNILVPFLCDKGDYGFAYTVCTKKLKCLCSVDESSLQNVVNGLAKNSMIKEAEILVQLGRSNSYFPYNLVMPSTE